MSDDDRRGIELPEISTVELIDLRGIHPKRVTLYLEAADKSPVFKVEGERADRIVSLWRSLPLGERARCHIPPVGVRFYSGADIACQATICWKCNNIFGTARGAEFSFAFDGQSREAAALFQAIRDIVGHEVLASESPDAS